jgi:hypothetical protein
VVRSLPCSLLASMRINAGSASCAAEDEDRIQSTERNRTRHGIADQCVAGGVGYEIEIAVHRQGTTAPRCGEVGVMVIIAIDGPAASDKGTIAKQLASVYGLHHLDTSLLYRAVAKAVLDAGYSPDDTAHAIEAAVSLDPRKFEDNILKAQAVTEAASGGRRGIKATYVLGRSLTRRQKALPRVAPLLFFFQLGSRGSPSNGEPIAERCRCCTAAKSRSKRSSWVTSDRFTMSVRSASTPIATELQHSAE